MNPASSSFCTSAVPAVACLGPMYCFFLIIGLSLGSTFSRCSITAGCTSHFLRAEGKNISILLQKVNQGISSCSLHLLTQLDHAVRTPFVQGISFIPSITSGHGHPGLAEVRVHITRAFIGGRTQSAASYPRVEAL